MADTQVDIPIVDGSGLTQSQLCISDGSGNIAGQTAIRVNGAFASTANPLPTQQPALPGIFSTVAESSHILKASAGTLYSLQFNCTDIGWLMLFDSATVPSNGAVSPRRAWYFTAVGADTLDKTFNPPLQMTNGAVLVFSTTGPFLLTLGAASAQFSAEMQ